MSAVCLIVYGYTVAGLRWAGISLSVAATFDLVLVWLTARRLYGFVLMGKAVKMLALQLPFGVVTFLVTTQLEGVAYWMFGGLCIFCSTVVSVRILLRETTILQELWNKVRRRIGR